MNFNMIVDKGTSKITIIILGAIIAILAVVFIFVAIQSNLENQEVKKRLETISENGTNAEAPKTLSEQITNINVVPTMQDTVSGNSAWCGTFQLVWNDMQDNLVDGKVKFDEENEMVTNLNKQSFTQDSIPEEYYYKNWGVKSPSLKSEIEKGIKDRFNETSDILDLFDWPQENDVRPDEYFFYSMLRRDFEFEYEFDILEKGKFGNTENVEYFGITEETDEMVRDQVEVLYYTDSENFAVTLYTKQGDLVTLVRNPEGKNFEEIYKNIDKKYEKYKGSKNFGEKDTLSIPNLNIDALKEYTELENKPFKLKDGTEAVIGQAFQTIKMKLDNKGGSVKSEAGMAITKGIAPEEENPRNFNFNDKFTIFLVSESNTPYFSANIEDITLFK